MSERVGEEDELGRIEKGGGEKWEWERAQKERERKKEAQAGHPHIAHSYLTWLSLLYSTFHDSFHFSPQKQLIVSSTAAVAVNSDGLGGGGEMILSNDVSG